MNPTLDSVAQSRPFNLSVFSFWSICSHPQRRSPFVSRSFFGAQGVHLLFPAIPQNGATQRSFMARRRPAPRRLLGAARSTQPEELPNDDLPLLCVSLEPSPCSACAEPREAGARSPGKRILREKNRDENGTSVARVFSSFFLGEGGGCGFLLVSLSPMFFFFGGGAFCLFVFFWLFPPPPLPKKERERE